MKCNIKGEIDLDVVDGKIKRFKLYGPATIKFEKEYLSTKVISV